MSFHILESLQDSLLSIVIIYCQYRYIQWRSQKFRLEGARLKDKIGNKKLI